MAVIVSGFGIPNGRGAVVNSLWPHYWKFSAIEMVEFSNSTCA
jgi:hypothetical protein